MLSDALHTATDALALVISYFALRLGDAKSTHSFTFGLKRAEIMAAVLNSGVLIGLSLWLMYEAVMRFIHPEPIEPGIMAGVALIGLIANIVMAVMLQRGSKENLNMRAAYLHVLSDAIVSICVIAGGIVILVWESATWVDPLLTVLISIWLIKASWAIVWHASKILMMAAPESPTLEEIDAAISDMDGVCNVHHAHLWALNEQNVHFEAHVEIEDRMVSQTTELLNRIEHELHEHFGINHATIQFESGRCKECSLVVDKDTE
nr:cation diffusion facilitator family transporter [Ruficoccus sp. ZRK36]